jgi:hypothetical protein
MRDEDVFNEQDKCKRDNLVYARLIGRENSTQCVIDDGFALLTIASLNLLESSYEFIANTY